MVGGSFASGRGIFREWLGDFFQILGWGMSTKIRFTKTSIDRLTAEDGKDTFYWDEKIPGFGVRVYPSGAKKYILQKRVGTGRLAKQTKIVIGDCEMLTPEEARSRAREMSMELRDGVDLTRKKSTDMSLADVMDYYIQNHSVAKKCHKEVIKITNLYINPIIGRVRMCDLDTADIRVFKEKAGKRSQAQANKALAYIKAAINFAMADFKELRQIQNPCRFVKKFKARKRRVFVTYEEMPALLKAINKEENPYARAAVMLFILLGQRKDEILRVRRDDIDFKAKRIYWEDTKNGEEHFLPLSDEAFEIIKMIPQVKGSPWLFPSINHARGLKGENHLKDLVRPWKRIREAANLQGKTIHDLRRTLGSWMAMGGEGLEMIGKILHHSGPKVTFDHYSHFQDAPIRDALNRHAAKVLSIKENQLN